VGTSAASVYYSGPRGAFERHREVLALIGAPLYLGDQPERAQWMYLAQLDVFLTAIAAVEHATALLASIGMPSSEVVPALLETLGSTPSMMAADEGEAADPVADQRAAIMMGATADHIVLATAEAGIDRALPDAVQEHFRRAIASGRGRDTWAGAKDGASA
jgi:3-hydroxyisobutyrate dehydrogenase-like beta-hydroxyacid dehydrogenase